jgi:hypothetical protein
MRSAGEPDAVGMHAIAHGSESMLCSHENILAIRQSSFCDSMRSAKSGKFFRYHPVRLDRCSYATDGEEKQSLCNNTMRLAGKLHRRKPSVPETDHVTPTPRRRRPCGLKPVQQFSESIAQILEGSVLPFTQIGMKSVTMAGKRD